VYRFYLSWGETYTKDGFCKGRIDLPRHCMWSNSRPVIVKGKIYFTPLAYSTYKVRMERFNPKTEELECLGTQTD
jgi:hypothetical protein